MGRKLLSLVKVDGSWDSHSVSTDTLSSPQTPVDWGEYWKEDYKDTAVGTIYYDRKAVESNLNCEWVTWFQSWLLF